MITSTYRRLTTLNLEIGALCFAWLVAAAAAPALAQSRSTHTDSVAQVIKAADIVRDPSDLPPPIGDRAPAVVKVTLTSKELVARSTRRAAPPIAIGPSTAKCRGHSFAFGRETRLK